jgi:hypothetical protein
MKERFNPEKKKGLVTCSFGSLIDYNGFCGFYIYANAAVLVFPIVFSFGGRVPIGFIVQYVFDSAFLSDHWAQQYLAIMVIRSGVKLRW